MSNVTHDVTGWLQAAAKYAIKVVNGLDNGNLPDRASREDDAEIEKACQLFIAVCGRYERACSRPRLGDDDSDLGPSQEQRR